MLHLMLLMIQATAAGPAVEVPAPHGPPLPNAEAYVATAPRLTSSISVDGVLDEPVWGSAARLNGFHQYQPVDSRPAEEETTVLVWYAPDAIYFGIHALDHDPQSIHATRAQRDRLDAEDRITIYLDTFDDRRRAYFFTVNPLGIQEDGIRSEGGFTAATLMGGTMDKNPDFVWQSRGQVTPGGYDIEIRIPFKSLRYAGGGQQQWGLNVERMVQRTGYHDTWTDTRRANASFLVQSGTLNGLHDMHRGIVTEIQPEAIAAADGFRDTTGAYVRNGVDPSMGVNLRLGLSSSTTVSATYNPDYSQIESDVAQVTLNERFALYYPEKRPFFLENIESFNAPNRLIYTRQVAAPVWGGKVTGNAGRLSIAYLGAEDQIDGPDAFFNVARLRADVATSSTVGLVLTDRRTSFSSNSVAAADARIVFGKLYYVAGQLGMSWSAAGGPSTTAPLWDLEYDRTGRAWGFNYKVTGIGKDFIDEAGFIPRNNVVQARAFNRFSWYGAPGALVEQVRTTIGFNGVWQYSGLPADQPLEGNVDLGAMFTLRGGWGITPDVSRGFIHFIPGSFDSVYVDYGDSIGVYHPPVGVDDAYTIALSGSTPTWRMFDANAEVAFSRVPIFAEGSTGDAMNLSADLGVRPMPALRIDGSVSLVRINRASDGSEFAREIIPRLRLEYQVTRPLFVRVVGQYISERQAALYSVDGFPLIVDGAPALATTGNTFGLEALISYSPVPGTIAFFGYAASMETPNSFGFSSLQTQQDGFFVKLAYTFRR
jgi:hypothetical protein